jgi:hypothetical protein
MPDVGIYINPYAHNYGTTTHSLNYEDRYDR